MTKVRPKKIKIEAWLVKKINWPFICGQLLIMRRLVNASERVLLILIRRSRLKKQKKKRCGGPDLCLSPYAPLWKTKNVCAYVVGEKCNPCQQAFRCFVVFFFFNFPDQRDRFVLLIWSSCFLPPLLFAISTSETVRERGGGVRGDGNMYSWAADCKKGANWSALGAGGSRLSFLLV